MMKLARSPEIIKTTATFDLSETYRYRLRREWGDGPAVAFLMLNPSTADAEADDPTVRRCIRYAQAWGFGALEVVNLFALRSTDPAALYTHHDPIGPENDAAILACRREVELMVAAWGAHGALHGRGVHVLDMLKIHGPIHYLKMTLGGQPGHPLYLPKDLKPMEIA